MSSKNQSRANDPINPDHYKSYSVETIDMMVAIYGKEKTAIHCELTAFKYRQRLGKKDSLGQDGELRSERPLQHCITRQEIADHLGIPVDQLEIVE